MFQLHFPFEINYIYIHDVMFFSCTFHTVGTAAGEQKYNSLCILSLNIINEKVRVQSAHQHTLREGIRYPRVQRGFRVQRGLLGCSVALRVQRSLVRVQRGLVGSALDCFAAVPDSIPPPGTPPSEKLFK